jgi:valyl-tRNA synthetase
MVMFNRYFRDGRLPYRHVYINPMIQDGHGQRMSKSLGNGVDPRDMIHSHGADALRYVMCQIATSTQDVRLPVDAICPKCETSFHPKEITSPAGYRVAAPEQKCPKCDTVMVTGYGVASGQATATEDKPQARNGSSKFDEGRNFANKVWNASRFALANLEERDGETERRRDEVEEVQLVDRWIVSRLHKTLHAVEDAVAEYQFNVYADAMYDFIWGDFCDWYLEAVKPTVRSSPSQQQVLRTVLNATLRLLHPICPFVTETLFPHVQATGEAGVEGVTLPDADMLATAAWPDIACRIHDQAALDTFDRIQKLVVTIRTMRGSHGVPPKKQIRLAAPAGALDLIGEAEEVVATLAGLERIDPLPAERPAGAIPLAFEGHELLLEGVVDAVDADAERGRLEKLIEAKQKAIRGFEGKLGNEKYVNNAPAAVVEETRNRLAEAQADLTAAMKALESLDGL